MLFADLEGSTKLLDALGPHYGALVEQHRRLIRDTLAAYRGTEVDWAGDGFFAVFRRARDGVAAAGELQTALAAEAWPNAAEVRMRVGVHTGEPELGDEGYIGMDVVRAARICAAAHGGQVVVSHATRTLLGDGTLGGASFRPLGTHRLKDIPGPEALYQLVAKGLADGFPPLRSLTDSNLPPLHHRLVGRERELAQIEALLVAPGVRLVTICGPGGAGKSRLALEVAAHATHERPVYLAGLASISDSALVTAAIARAAGVRESPEEPLVAGIAEALAGSNALLVLDNLEHLDGAAAEIRTLLDRARDLVVLATSRSRLDLAGERVVRLEPLPADEAMTFFGELAQARGIELPSDSDDTVRAICRRLDGLPLAIELVAARLTVLSPPALLRALDDGLALSTKGSADLPERQRTLRTTIEWSYGLLSERQRELHSTLAVFAGGCTLDDGRAIARADAEFLADVEALVAGSLLRSDADADGEPRLAMLETVREYAIARLEGLRQLDSARDRHSALFLALAIDAEAALAGADQAVWLDRLEREHDNLRAALDWALASGRVEDMLRAVSALGRFWRAHGHVREARGWLQAGLQIPGIVPEVRARGLWTEARQAMAQSDHDSAVPQLQEAFVLFGRTGEATNAVFALGDLSLAMLRSGKHHEAERLAEEALGMARGIDDPRTVSGALNNLGNVYNELERFDAARRLFNESLTLRRGLADMLLVANTANNLGFAAMRDGDLSAAEAAFEECLTLAQQLGDSVHTASATLALGEIALVRGDTPRAALLLQRAFRSYDALGDERTKAECLHALGGVAAAGNRLRDAARLWSAAEAVRQRLGAEPTSEERAVDERFASQVRSGLDAETLRRARVEGQIADVDELLVTAALGAEGHPE
jgi:predicted ATPase/class 3 adenylate cyclase